MTRRRPPLAERRPSAPAADAPGYVQSHLVTTAGTTAPGDLSLRIGGEGTALGVDPHGAALGVRLFRPAPTRIVLVGSPRCAQLIAYRALASGARITIGTARPQTWGALAAAAPVTVHPVHAGPPPAAGRTQPLLHIDDAPPYGRPPELPDGRWTTVLTLREALTHRETELLDRADLLLLQPLTSAELEVLTSVLKVPGIDNRLAGLPADVLTVAHRRGVRWGRLSVTPIEHHLFGSASRR